MTKKTYIAGPCVIESAELLDEVARQLVAINCRLHTDIIFKASFDKANRTSIRSFRGPGLEKGLQMLADVKSRYGLRILTAMRAGRQPQSVRWWMSSRYQPSSAGRPICWWRQPRQAVRSISRKPSSSVARTWSIP